MLEFFPTLTPSLSGFRIVPMVDVKRNPYSNVETVYDEGASVWQARLQWAFVPKVQAREIRGFLNKQIRGGRFYLSDTAHTNDGNWNGAIVVDGSNQSGAALSVRGATPNATFAHIGDRFTLNGFLYELIEPATADGTGRAVLRFATVLRRIPADGAALITESPYGTFMIANFQQIPTFSQNRLGIKNLSLDFIEALRK